MRTDIKITTTIPREIIENIFITAIEGGSNYWAYIDKIQWLIMEELSSDNMDVQNKMCDGGEIHAMVATILDAKVDIEINCVENNDKVLGILSAKTIKNRLQSLSDHNNYSRFLYAELNGEGDAESSDVIFQYLVLGEVIYG